MLISRCLHRVRRSTSRRYDVTNTTQGTCTCKGLALLSSSAATHIIQKPAPAAPPPAVDPALSAQMCVMLKEQGNEHFKAGRYDAALRAYERAAAHDPSNPHLWLNNAAALLKLDRPEEAIWYAMVAILV